ncbi:hypothetical protein Q1695_000520 [Nippostrongylus brasiliensis]|nr:hypothetical protein Q1695_000520 [Nippostrongylus brasiliensis]
MGTFARKSLVVLSCSDELPVSSINRVLRNLAARKEQQAMQTDFYDRLRFVDPNLAYSGQWYNQWTTMPMPGVGLTPFSSIPHQPPAETKKDPAMKEQQGIADLVERNRVDGDPPVTGQYIEDDRANLCCQLLPDVVVVVRQSRG